MKKFRHNVRYSMRSYTRVIAFLLAAFAGGAFTGSALASETPAPSAQERAELAKFPSYTGNIEVISPNEGNGLHEFLDANEDQTVFIETTVLRYKPAPEGVTAKTRDRIPPTDRFENPVFQKCWGDEINQPGRLVSGDEGFPLPLDQADIEAGCAARVKIDLTDGDFAGNMNAQSGTDKTEIYFIGFFEVKKETLGSGKTLYHLIETAQPDATIEAFYKFATRKDRPMRQVWVEETQTPSDAIINKK